MPIEVLFRDNGQGIEFFSFGIVTGEEIIAANEQIYTRENLPRLKYKIIDRTSCTEYCVSPEEIRTIAAQDKQAATVNPNIIVVLISTTPLQYGMSRMWQTHVEDSGFETKIFKDRENALAWLKTRMKEIGKNTDTSNP